MGFTIAALLVVAILLLAAARKLIFPRQVLVQQYQRGVLSNRGVYEKTLGPGAYWILRHKSIVPVDMRLQVLTVPGQEVLSSDGMSFKVTAAGEFQVEDAATSVHTTVNPVVNLYFHAQQALREALAGIPFERILEDRTGLNTALYDMVAPHAATMGLKLHNLQIRDVMLSGELKRAFAQTLTAQKEGLAALERARGETAALRSLANAARLMEENPALLQLRALQTMETTKGNTLVLGVGAGDVVVKKSE
jgi:regulator of protease activity HflC (stomatin/prohibitin superfamily)